MSTDREWNISADFFSDYPDVVAVWVFGSAIEGRIRLEGDLDLGVLFDFDPEMEELAGLRADLQKATGIEEIDLVALNRASSILRFEAVTGRMIYMRDAALVAEFASLTAREYEDDIAFFKSGMRQRRIQMMVDRFTSLAEEQIGDELVSVIVYGSVARGEARPESDIDILVVIEKGSEVYYERLQPFLAILDVIKHGRSEKRQEGIHPTPEISVLVMTREEASENKYLFLDMIEDAHVLFDRNRFFEKRLNSLAERLEELGSQRVQSDGSWYWDLKPDLKPGEVVAL